MRADTYNDPNLSNEIYGVSASEFHRDDLNDLNALNDQNGQNEL